MRRGEKAPEGGIPRIEAFSDGVFAIAITLLILEIKVPYVHETDHVANLAAALRAEWPYYLAYVFSFIVVGIYWANHHYLFRFFHRTDHIFNLLNVFFLMCISFLPFPTAILSEYFTDPHNHSTAISFYTLGLLLPALGWSLVWFYGSYHYRLIDDTLEERFVGYLSRQYILSPVLYFLALAVSFASGTAALAIAIGLTLLYLFPPKKPVYRKEGFMPQPKETDRRAGGGGR